MESDQADTVYRAEQARYRAIFESVADALLVIEQDGTIVEANQAMGELFGYSRNELVGRYIGNLAHPDEGPAIADHLRQLKAEGDTAQIRRTRAIRQGGTVFYVEIRSRVFEDEYRRRVLAVARDITEQVEAEQELRKPAEQLAEREVQYRRIFESSSDGVIINDPTRGVVVEANPAVCQMHGYSYEEFIGLHGTEFIHPDYHPVFVEFLETIVRGGTYQCEAIDTRKDGSPFHVEVHGSNVMYQGRPHILALVRDITERVQARELLEQRVAERTRELSTLLEVSRNVTSTLELQPLLDLILEQLKEVVDYNGVAVFLLDDKGARIVGFRSPRGEADPPQVEFPVSQHNNLSLRNLPHPTIIDDVRGDSPEARGLRTVLGDTLESYYTFVRSWMAVPMSVKDRVIGYIHLTHGDPGFYTSHHADLALAIAQQAAIAIENARLFEQTVQRTSELSVLLEVSRDVASTLELRPLLGLILDQLNLVADNDGITLLEVRGDEFVVLLRRVPGHEDQEFPTSYSTQSHGPIWEKLRRGEVVIIGNVRGDDPLARAYQGTVGDYLNSSLSFERSFMAVPLMLKDRIIGLLGLTSARPDYYTPHHGELALAIAQQAAIAIENARLYEQAQEVAVVEERQRLSRELHDSVSQALYSIALGAKTARALADRDPGRVAEPLDFVLAQAERGLAEMRALIFELRPEALEQDGLVSALAKQVDALRARHRLQVEVMLGEEPEVALPAKDALYRIAQEALQNVIKHANAASVQVRLDCQDGVAVLEIRDDGMGFDADQSFPGHLGLTSMAERAVRLGGTVDIASEMGQGTRVYARIPLSPQA